MIDPGSFRQRVTLQRDTGTTFANNGQAIEDWTDLGEYWALVETLSGREQYYAVQVTPTASHRVTMWQVQPIFTTDRFSFEGQTLNVESVIKIDNQNAFYQLTCSSQPTTS